MNHEYLLLCVAYINRRTAEQGLKMLAQRSLAQLAPQMTDQLLVQRYVICVFRLYHHSPSLIYPLLFIADSSGVNPSVSFGQSSS